MSNTPVRPDFFSLPAHAAAIPQSRPASRAFSATEYDHRLEQLRRLMSERQLDAVLLTSMHNIAYYSGFLYCALADRMAVL